MTLRNDSEDDDFFGQAIESGRTSAKIGAAHCVAIRARVPGSARGRARPRRRCLTQKARAQASHRPGGFRLLGGTGRCLLRTGEHRDPPLDDDVSAPCFDTLFEIRRLGGWPCGMTSAGAYVAYDPAALAQP